MGITCGTLLWRLNMHKLNSYFGMAENDYLYAKGGMETCRRLGNYNGSRFRLRPGGGKIFESIGGTLPGR